MAAWWLCLCLSSAGAADRGFEAYQLILDRQPFGDPSAETLRQAPTAPEESFARHLRLCAFVETADGALQVGLVDTQSNRHFFMGVGETVEGIELVAADFTAEEAVLRRGEEVAVIQLASGEVQTRTPAASRMQATGQDEREARRLSYIERRRQREAERRERAPPAQPRLTGQELERHLQEYQMEVIRKGLPPLPIPLTPEMDDQLVHEGVLPPVQ